MTRRVVAVLVTALTVASVSAGAFYSWTRAAGVFWFGASFLMLVWVMNSFKGDSSSGLNET